MNTVVFAPTSAEVTNCDREPIHIPGAILPHGAMLVLDDETLEVIQVAGHVGLLGAAHWWKIYWVIPQQRCSGPSR